MAGITIEHVARIEGHGNVHIEMAGGVVTDVRLDVVEPARFFESMVVGRRFDEVPLIASRICGICSPTHVLTATKALEDAMEVSISERTRAMRELLLYGSYLQNHATHLYLFAAPDYVSLPSAFSLAGTHPEVLERALRIKKLGNELTALIGGRAVHPVTVALGGFTSEPDPAALRQVIGGLERAAGDAAATSELFSAFDEPELVTAGEMLALTAEGGYAIYDGEVTALDGGWRRPVREYSGVLSERVVGHGNAKHSTVDGRTFMVGALPRINLSSGGLTPPAREALERAGLKAPSRNPFMNNLCQAVELVDCAERCAGLARRVLEMGGSTARAEIVPVAGAGSAATEAPRGTLYHAYEVNADGIVTHGDVITPTAQNLANLEADMRAFAPLVVDRPREVFLGLVERLVRAYDPCLSCSVH